MTDAAIGWTIIVALFNCELLYRAWLFFSQHLKANEDATRLAGWYRGWQLTHVTGRVLGANAHTVTSGSSSVYGSTAGSGSVYGSGRIITNLHEALRLQRSDGTQTTVNLVNYNVTAQPGDVISVWGVQKRSKAHTIAVLNLSVTPETQAINRQDVFRILQPHQIFFVVWLVLAAPCVILASVFASSALPLVFWLSCLALYTVGQYLARKRFERKGIVPIWRRGRDEARLLVAS